MHVTTVMRCNTFFSITCLQTEVLSFVLLNISLQISTPKTVTLQSFFFFFCTLLWNAVCVLNKLAVLLILITESLLIYHG